MKSLIVCTLVLACTAAVNGQNNGGYQHDTAGDQGVEYVHNPDWDLTPFERYKLKKAAEQARSSGCPVDLAAVQASRAAAPRPNQIPTNAAVLPKRVKAVRRPAAAAAAPQNQPSFQNFQARNVFSQPPRPQAAAIPRPAAPRPAPAPRQQAAPQQLGLLQQSAGAAYTQTAHFGQQQQQPVRQQQLAVFQAAPTAAPRRPAPAAPVQFRAVPAVRATPAPATRAAAAVPAAIQTPQFIAQNTQHPDPNFWNRAYEYQAPSYAAKAAGSSYTYVANL